MQNEPDRDVVDVAKLVEALPDLVSEQRGLRRLESALDRLRQDPAEQQRVQEIIEAAEAGSLAQRPTTGGAGVFINYRTVDNPLGAGGIHDALASRFGANKVFRDSVSLEAGANYPSAIRDALVSSDVLVSIIGPNWLTLADDATGERLIDREHDWVRRELVWARERNIAVVPVLLVDTPARAILPQADELPSDLRWLARLQAFEFSQHRFDTDLDRLAARLAALAPGLTTTVGPGYRAGLRQPSPDAFAELVTALESVPCMLNDETRALLVASLRSAISGSIPHGPQRRAHVESILVACLNYEHGMIELMEAIDAFEAEDSVPYQRLLAVLGGILPKSRSRTDVRSE